MMKKHLNPVRTTLALIPVVFFFSCVAEKDNMHNITFENTSDYDVQDKILPVEINQLSGYLVEKLPLFITAEGDTLPTQFNQDEELLILLDIPSKQSKTVSITWLDKEAYSSFPARTNVFLGYSANRDGNFVSVKNHKQPEEHKPMDYPLRYQSEGPIWESELVAYRSYFDARNGKDIFGKVKPSIRAEKIGLDEDYHQLQDWGMDVLKVGNSLGAGALAIKHQDSLYRLGETSTASFKILENGPIRSVFSLFYTGWQVDDQTLSLTETITIEAGKRFFKSQIEVEGINSKDTLITGIVTLKEPEIKETSYHDHIIVSTHGMQSENKDFLGMAIFTADKYHAGSYDAPLEGDGIVSTRIVRLVPENNVHTFFFTAGWEKEHEDFVSHDKFIKSIQNSIDQVHTKIKITY